MLLALSCGDDDTPQDPTAGSSSSGEADSSTGPTPTETTVEPTSSSTVAEPTSAGVDSSTGPAVECGNGIVDEGEECDDMNVLDDDECSSVCRIPFVELWTATYDGGDADTASHALFDAEGNLYVLGSTQVVGQGYDLWLRQYSPEGREGFTWTYDGAFGEDDFGRRMAWLDGDLVIVGTETTETNGEDALVLRLAIGDQSVVWSQTIDGQGSGPDPIDNDDFGTSIAVDGDGNILVTANLRVDMQEYDMAVRKLDGDGVELWVRDYDNPDFHGSDTVDVVLADASGDIYFAGDSEISPSTFEAFVRKLDTDGNELWTQNPAGVALTNGALDPDGNLLLAGIDNDSKNGNIWVAKYDPDFAELGSSQHDGPSGAYDAALGVAAGPSGDVYVSGYVTVVGEQSNIWAGRWASDLGLRWWSTSYGNMDSLLADDGRNIAVSDDESRVAVVGLESVIGQDTNVWVRMLQNNPAPGQ
jgi:cysteine-rich repeat protein